MIVVIDKDKKRNVMKLELSRKSKAVTEGMAVGIHDQSWFYGDFQEG